MSVGRQALEKLLRSAERASITGAQPRDFVFSQTSLPAYAAIGTRIALDDVHTELFAAERAGVIGIEWERRAGERGKITRITLQDRDLLARHLQVVPLWQALQEAQAALSPWNRPQVAILLDAWRQGKQPRGRAPQRVHGFVDALRALDRLAESPSVIDRSVRRFSAQVFGDSKRIDELSVELDLLTRQDDGPPRTDAEVFSELGLVVHQQPFLLAGHDLEVNTEARQVPILRPYLGVPTQTLRGVRGSPAYILSLENLDTFHELALGAAGEVRGLLLFTGGMPSPSWLNAFGAVLESVTADTPLLHWGDTDIGGVRILRKLDDFASGRGRRVMPFQMGVRGAAVHKTLPSADARYLVRIATERGWQHIAEHFASSADTFEQQTQQPQLP